MGESLYGKFAFTAVTSGITVLAITFFVTILFGWLMPENTDTMLYGLFFFIIIVGIVLGIVGIIRDDSREKAIRALVAGVIFLIIGIVLYVVYNTYLSALFGSLLG